MMRRRAFGRWTGSWSEWGWGWGGIRDFCTRSGKRERREDGLEGQKRGVEVT